MHYPQYRIRAEEYLRAESTSKCKHEYWDGETFAMPGGTQAHSIISLNISSILKARLKGSGCRAHASDLLVHVEATNSFYYPDALVDCGAYDPNSRFTKTPALIFEVLSPSTASTDRREKLVAYKRIPSLKAYVLIQQARKRIEIYRRENDNWTLEQTATGGTIVLAVCPEKDVIISIDVEDIYEDSGINDPPNLSVREDFATYVW